jgi:GNAT superfamily N-acetyltransferase
MTRIDVATTADLDDLLASVAGLFVEDGGRFDPTMDTTWPAHGGADYYGRLVDDDTSLLALAREGGSGRTLGHLVGKLTGPDDLRRVRIAVLESMRVAPDARGRGVGTALVAHFLDWARSNGAGQAGVSAFAGNEGAQRFYARHGFTPMSVTLRADL